MAQHCLFVVASLVMFLAFLAVGVGFFAPFWLGNVTTPAPGSGGGANVEDPNRLYLSLNASSVYRPVDYRWRGLWAQCSRVCQWFWTNDYQLQEMKFNELSELRRIAVKLKFHGTDTDSDTDTDVLADLRSRILARKFPVKLAASRTRTTILADLSADSTDTRAFPREDPRQTVR